MSEKNESLKQIVLAGFNAAAASEDAPIKQTEEELLALIKKLPLDRLRGLRAELDGMIAEKLINILCLQSSVRAESPCFLRKNMIR